LIDLYPIYASHSTPTRRWYKM